MTGIQIEFQVPELPGFRDLQGRFTAAQRESTARNARLAIVVQGDVVARMRNRIAFGRRGSASTGRLLQVTAGGENVRYNQYGFGVGVPKVLDRSVAKYWRTFEEGSAAVWRRPFIGTQLIQFRKNPTGRPSAHGTDLRTAKKGGAFTGYRGAAEGKFIVSREIQPAYIYRDAFHHANLQEEGMQAALFILRRVFQREISPGGGYFR